MKLSDVKVPDATAVDDVDEGKRKSAAAHDGCTGSANIMCLRCWKVVHARCNCSITQWCQCGRECQPWDPVKYREKWEEQRKKDIQIL